MPKVSIFTPSHRPAYLDAAFCSVMAQTVDDWEWVIVLNNGAEWQPPYDDDRVRVLVSDELDKGIGFYKREAAGFCQGEILLELDHDDLLHEEAVESVIEAFEIDPSIVFAYSDFAQINEDGSPNTDEFDLNHGWTYRDDEGYHVCSSFPPYPSNIGYIWYAPNHLRAFRRSTYQDIGGYSADHFVLDDHDLMVRLYVTGEFYHIKDCLYYQRVHKNQSQADLEMNAKIQSGTVAIYQHNIERMALTWAKRRGLRVLDLGSAHNKPAGYEGVDKHAGPGVDIVSDIMDLMLPPNSVGVIRAVDFLEHVSDKVALMNRLWELLAHGGMLLSMTPSTDGRGAWQDPTHVSGWNENSFWYYTEDKYRAFVPEIEAKFHPSRVETFFPSEWHQSRNIPYVLANLVAVKKAGPDFGGTPWI